MIINAAWARWESRDVIHSTRTGRWLGQALDEIVEDRQLIADFAKVLAATNGGNWKGMDKTWVRAAQSVLRRYQDMVDVIEAQPLPTKDSLRKP